jgi:hypothetical protein
MKRFQFLLLDTGPIIKLFELDLWDQFIDKCHVTVSRTVANQAQYASQELEDVRVDLQPYEDNGLISIFDSEPSTVRTFYEQFSQLYRAIIHSGKRRRSHSCAIPQGIGLCVRPTALSSESWACSEKHSVVFR